MKTIEYTTIDKSDWGPGPWQSEPDKVQYQDELTGLPCLIVRGPQGNLCGYVGVPESHPLFGMDYSDVTNISVHGGLTFSSHCSPHGRDESSICHIPEPGETDRVWWLGFDCGHYLDFSPILSETMRKVGLHHFMDHCVYRDIDYVKAEIADLAKQLK